MDALIHLWNNPSDLLQLIWDDESREMWENGDYGGAIGRTIWNVGSFFIPGVNLAKIGAKGGKLGKLAELASSLGQARRLADDAADAADTAADAARRGDVDAATEAAEEARRHADEAAEEARQRGCPVAAGRGGSTDGVLALAVPEGSLLVTAVTPALRTAVLLAGGEGCGDLTDAASEADEAADIAEGVASTPQRALDTLDTIDETGAPPAGYRGGSTFQNDGRGGGEVLPRTGPDGSAITYQEWDVNPYTPGVNRGAERLVTGSDGSVYWTDDHYGTFTRIR